MSQEKNSREELGMLLELTPLPAGMMMATPGPLESANFTPSREGALILADAIMASDFLAAHDAKVRAEQAEKDAALSERADMEPSRIAAAIRLDGENQ